MKIVKGLLFVVVFMGVTGGTGYGALHLFSMFQADKTAHVSLTGEEAALTSRSGPLLAASGVGPVENSTFFPDGLLVGNRLDALPEPIAMLLFGVGLVGLAGVVSKIKRK